MNQSEENRILPLKIGAEPPKAAGASGEPSEDKKQADQAKGKEKDKAKFSWMDNGRLAWLGAGLVLVVVLCVFGLWQGRKLSRGGQTGYMPSRTTQSKEKGTGKGSDTDTASGYGKLPMLDAGHSAQAETASGTITPDEVLKTAKPQARAGATTNLGSVAPFSGPQPWQPAPYQGGLQTPSSESDGAPGKGDLLDTRSEHDAMDKPSLVFVKTNSASAARSATQAEAGAIDWGLGLAPGTKLRAHLESAVNTAVSTPVVAVIEYNYEQNGEIVIPAGAKAFGHLEAADRSGYVGVRFESLEMPDGSSVKLEAAATDLALRPLRGKVEGKNTGKNILVRTFAGVGEIAATLVGQGSLNQPLSEADLLRGRVANNIGQASDQTVANLAITQRIVVSVPAGTEIYVVLQKPAKENAPLTRAAKTPDRQAASAPSIEELRQLLQLQKELGQSASAEQTSQ
jgi:hypothetical protein